MRKLGQHFLKNDIALKKIVTAMDLKLGGAVVEIGAGHGELTEKIFSAQLPPNEKIKIIAIEKDPRLVEFLKNKFSTDENIIIVPGDALKIIPELVSRHQLQTTNYKLVGNIPYYITGKLLRLVGDLDTKPEICVFTLQKEVAERAASIAPKMNRLAASVQFWSKPEVVGYIPKEYFAPPPEVDSAILKLRVKSAESRADAEKYYKTVKILFQQPRKTISNNLKQGLDAGNRKATEKVDEKLNEAGINPQYRPQNLNVDDIIRISRLDL